VSLIGRSISCAFARCEGTGRRTNKVKNWEEWERIHAEQDARDRKILGVVGLGIVLLVILLSNG
jgi:hypothetical protein